MLDTDPPKASFLRLLLIGGGPVNTNRYLLLRNMKIDLRQFVAPIVRQIERRVRLYGAATNLGPGVSDATIQQIVMGFQFDQAAWVSLVFDTRPDADPVYDGEWQSYIERNTLDCDVDTWMDAYKEIVENQTQVAFTAVDGEVVKLGPCENDDDVVGQSLAKLFGDVCREALAHAQAQFLFSSLPLAATVYLRVDEHECQYAWPDYDTRGAEDDEGRLVRC
ncbi:MAG: hypothetical protein NXI28_20835 [bacterium]|nr:hypothetical protein [bacterium]